MELRVTSDYFQGHELQDGIEVRSSLARAELVSVELPPDLKKRL
jgi:hypothetical protein